MRNAIQRPVTAHLEPAAVARQETDVRAVPRSGEGPWAARHPIDVRASVSLLRRRFYFVILAGRERRNEARLLVDGQRVWWKVGLIYALLASQLVSLMIGWTVIAYVIKCFFGINLMSRTSPLHFVYEALFT